MLLPQRRALIILLVRLKMALPGERPLRLLSSLLLDGFIGQSLGLTEHLNRLGEKLAERFRGMALQEGFVQGFLLFCVGSISVLGVLQSGIQGDHSILQVKDMIDLVMSAVLAGSLGVEGIFLELNVLVYQGTITRFVASLKHIIVEALIR